MQIKRLDAERSLPLQNDEYDSGFLPLPSEVGINPEEASVQARQQAQGIERDVHGWARNGGNR